MRTARVVSLEETIVGVIFAIGEIIARAGFAAQKLTVAQLLDVVQAAGDAGCHCC